MNPPSSSDGADDELVEQGAFVDINVTPLVDVFLVLLVILMATSTAILEAGQGQGSRVPVQLPAGSESDELTDVKDQLVVAIPSGGGVIVRGESVSTTELEAILAAEAAKDPSQLVLVQADEEARHKRVVAVMEAARRAGLRNLAIATKPE